MAEEKNYNVLTTENGVPIKAWTKGVQLEDQARAAMSGLGGKFQGGTTKCGRR
jgi:hypothetical protein